jgi:hypothetical protein
MLKMKYNDLIQQLMKIQSELDDYRKEPDHIPPPHHDEIPREVEIPQPKAEIAIDTPPHHGTLALLQHKNAKLNKIIINKNKKILELQLNAASPKKRPPPVLITNPRLFDASCAVLAEAKPKDFVYPYCGRPPYPWFPPYDSPIGSDDSDY